MVTKIGSLSVKAWSNSVTPNRPQGMSSVKSRPVQSATSTRTSGTSGSIDMISRRYNHPSSIKPTGRRMIYTGPSGALSHQMKVGERGTYVGIAPLSQEVTSAAEYLYRPCTSNAPKCQMRHMRVGEIGWNVSTLLKNSVLPVVISPGRR